MYDNKPHVSSAILQGISMHLTQADKIAALVGQMANMSTVGSAPKAPSVPAPTVGTASIAKIKPIGPSKPMGGPKSTGGGMVTAPAGGGPKQVLAFLDEGLGPAMAGAAGGGLGYLAGSKIINPIIQNREAALRHKIETGQMALAGMKKTRKASPWIAGAVGALLLATIAARKARADEREKIETRKFWMAPENQGLIQEFQGAQAGFAPSEQSTINQQLPFY